MTSEEKPRLAEAIRDSLTPREGRMVAEIDKRMGDDGPGLLSLLSEAARDGADTTEYRETVRFVLRLINAILAPPDSEGLVHVPSFKAGYDLAVQHVIEASNGADHTPVH